MSFFKKAVNIGLSAIPGVGGYLGTVETNKANSALSQKQMDFQQYNSDTAYQRSMADMKKAGLNPMLAYQQGGASSPGGSMAQMQNPAAGMSESIVNSARAYMEKQMNENAIRKTDADIGQIEANKKLQDAQTDLTKTQAKIATKEVPAAELKAQAGQIGVSILKPILDSISNSAKKSKSLQPSGDPLIKKTKASGDGLFHHWLNKGPK